ncbi:hypothetical protein BLNAU_11701 [Blattamonas nauphoetae]|uniref:Uncharacterized protein n=1 Tax=Blattamonas nauphoetae TaxID=2049346 RepID=A0ABQ9XQE0_9EUKA|nr:hypothetical protein BLNAU_11701 [Blattamonas nauphoetae]
MSLVDYIQEGNNLDEKATKQACTLLKRISSRFSRTTSSYDILVELVPAHNRSCSSFTTSIVPLLTSSNEKLVDATLSILGTIAFDASDVTLFVILETGLFALLPRTFYEHEMHTLPPYGSFLTSIVVNFLFEASPGRDRFICKERQISTEYFQQTYIDKFFSPIEPFLD